MEIMSMMATTVHPYLIRRKTATQIWTLMSRRKSLRLIGKKDELLRVLTETPSRHIVVLLAANLMKVMAIKKKLPH
jgi:hypothetical protein